MAAINYDDYGSGTRGGSLTAVLNWAGAFLSVLLIAGLATWGWKLWVRDVTGVPVVRALEGPMRVAPEEPGGLASNYQGLTVNRIAEEQAQAAPADQVVLAPEPTILNEDEDLAMAALPSVEDEPIVPAGELLATPDIGEPLVVVNDSDGLVPFDNVDPADEALASVLPDMATPETVLPEETTLSATDLAVQLALGVGTADRPDPSEARIVAAAHVPVVTPRPLVRPANLRVVSAPAVNVPAGEVDPATIPAGTRLVQLGAFANQDLARAEWQIRLGKFGDYMVGKSAVLQEAETGGRAFYRLRAMGFDDLSEARRFCAVLVAEGANCIPVVHD
jgi:hypothetical protein